MFSGKARSGWPADKRTAERTYLRRSLSAVCGEYAAICDCGERGPAFFIKMLSRNARRVAGAALPGGDMEPGTALGPAVLVYLVEPSETACLCWKMVKGIDSDPKDYDCNDYWDYEHHRYDVCMDKALQWRISGFCRPAFKARLMQCATMVGAGRSNADHMAEVPAPLCAPLPGGGRKAAGTDGGLTHCVVWRKGKEYGKTDKCTGQRH